MGDYILLAISCIFVNNILLAQFLGQCPFLGTSKKMETATGMSMAVVFVMVMAGMILLIPFAQFVGHAGVWQVIMGDDYQRVAKVAAEEFVELGAYAIITIGAFEFLYAWSRLPRTRNIAAAPKKRRK